MLGVVAAAERDECCYQPAELLLRMPQYLVLFILANGVWSMLRGKTSLKVQARCLLAEDD